MVPFKQDTQIQQKKKIEAMKLEEKEFEQKIQD